MNDNFKIFFIFLFLGLYEAEKGKHFNKKLYRKSGRTLTPPFINFMKDDRNACRYFAPNNPRQADFKDCYLSADLLDD